MNARVYLNTSTNSATSRIDGGGFSPPPVRAYSDVILRFRLSREIEGESVPDDREIDSVSARIGFQDTEPTSGTVTLDITLGSDTVTTAALAYDAAAAQVKAAIDLVLDGSALDALHPCTCEDTDEGYRIIFADTDETVTIAAGSNKLWPMSFVNADRVEFDGGWATLLAYRQAPVAEVATAEETVPGVPTITEEQPGFTEDGNSQNAIQRITLNPAYSGATWRLVWDGVKGSLLPGFPTVEQLQESLDLLKPEGGIFTLLAVEDGVLVEFAGIMAGEPQSVMTAVEFTPPPTEWLVKLPTATAAMRTMMAGAGTDNEIELPMDIVVTVLDDDAPSGTQKLVFPFEVTFTRPVGDDARNVSAALDWTQPLSRTSNAPFSTNSLLVGNRGMRFTVGDGSATSFLLPHNLGSLSGAFTVNASTDVCSKTGHNLHNGDPVTVSTSGTVPGGLSAGGTYYIVSATTDTFKLAATPNGTAIDITSTGSGTHTITVADGTTDVVFFEVWEASGLKRRVSPEDYTVAITTDDAVTLSGFASTPTSGQYKAVMMTAGRPATYQAHTHPISEVTGLQAIIDSLGERVSALEALAPAGVPFTETSTGAGAISRTLLPVWNVLRSRILPEVPDGLLGWSPYTLASPLRSSRLLPAVHVSSTETLPTPLPAPGAAYTNKVYTTATARTDFPGGLLAGDYAACDGREWYRVAKETSSQKTYYPTAFNLELFRLAVNENQLVTRSVAEVLFGFEVALYPDSRNPRARRSAATWSLLLELGEWTGDTTPATTGSNLDEFFTSPVILAEQRIHITESPSQHRFGATVTRSGAGVLTATATKYGKEIAATAPSTANFALRARLARFDTENDPTDARGLIAIRGLSVGLDGQEDPTLGLLTIG